jgi:hypothetical protein
LPHTTQIFLCSACGAAFWQNKTDSTGKTARLKEVLKIVEQNNSRVLVILYTPEKQEINFLTSCVNSQLCKEDTAP